MRDLSTVREEPVGRSPAGVPFAKPVPSPGPRAGVRSGPGAHGPGILLVLGDAARRDTLARDLAGEGPLRVCWATDASAALVQMKSGPVDLAVLDSTLLGASGWTLLDRLAQQVPEGRAIILEAAHGAVPPGKVLHPGIVARLPATLEANALVSAIRSSLAEGTQRREARGRYGFESLIGRSSPMRTVLDLAQAVATSQVSAVFLRGESGTGKDLLARAIHVESPRIDAPFVTVMCTALQDTLLENDLFGHEKGAFTDARTQKKGLFELAAGGTIFLNEIGDMGPNLQAKLLRVLDERTFRRVGGTEDIQIDVRVIAATHRNLEPMIREGKFRTDLFYRLNVFPLSLPPLRGRREDIAALTHHFLDRFGRKFRKTFTGVTEEAVRRLEAYDWPGNVRELRNVLERATLLSAGPVLQAGDLSFWRLGAPASEVEAVALPPGGLNLDAVERTLIEQAVQRADGCQTRASKLLGISRYRLRTRLKRHGLHRCKSEQRRG